MQEEASLCFVAEPEQTEYLPAGGEELRFREFRLYPQARILLHRGREVTVGSRAFDLFHVLLASRGSIVTRSEIVAHVWPSTFVDESNLRFQICQLRKALGEDRDQLKTVPGRGYLLSVDVGDTRGPIPRIDYRPGVARERINGSAQGVERGAAQTEAADLIRACEEWQGLLGAVLDDLRQLTVEARASASNSL